MFKVQHTDADKLPAIVDYLRSRKSKAFGWIDTNTLRSGSGYEVRHTSRLKEMVWVLFDKRGVELTYRKRLIDVFEYFSEISLHNPFATKTLIR